MENPPVREEFCPVKIQGQLRDTLRSSSRSRAPGYMVCIEVRGQRRTNPGTIGIPQIAVFPSRCSEHCKLLPDRVGGLFLWPNSVQLFPTRTHNQGLLRVDLWVPGYPRVPGYRVHGYLVPPLQSVPGYYDYIY
eukprot:1886027-Rhodomonas_salina.2